VTLTVVTWLWNQPGGRTQFTAMHVNIWAAMIRRHCTLPIRLACVTDIPEGIDPSIRIIKPPGEFVGLETARWRRGRPNCYRRITMFRRDAARTFGKRFVCMDLDAVIGGNIDAILGRKEDFVICSPSQQHARYVYNGSMMLMTAGARPEVYDRFTPEEAEIASGLYVGSDQAWIGHVLGRGEATWGAAEGVVRWGAAQEGKIMFFPGNVKPWDAIAHPFVSQHYRLDGGRAGLVLGRGSSVWEEAQSALDKQQFDGVIAFPQSAAHWPGTVDAVADNMPHAKCLAKMLGFDTLTLCGV
jgi:hypothetical protein